MNHAPCGQSGGCRCGLRLRSPVDASRIIARILFVRVLLAAQAELAARMLPRLTLTIPVKSKLRQLLPNLGGGRLFECHPNPLADNLGQTVNVRRTGQQKVQNPWCGQCPVFLPRFRVNRQAIVRLGCGCWRNCALRLVVVCAAQLCGFAPEPDLIFCICFHGLFFLLCCASFVRRPSRKSRAPSPPSWEWSSEGTTRHPR